MVCAAYVSYGKASKLWRARQSNYPAKNIARRAGSRIPHCGEVAIWDWRGAQVSMPSNKTKRPGQAHLHPMKEAET